MRKTFKRQISRVGKVKLMEYRKCNQIRDYLLARDNFPIRKKNRAEIRCLIKNLRLLDTQSTMLTRLINKKKKKLIG